MYDIEGLHIVGGWDCVYTFSSRHIQCSQSQSLFLRSTPDARSQPINLLYTSIPSPRIDFSYYCLCLHLLPASQFLPRIHIPRQRVRTLAATTGKQRTQPIKRTFPLNAPPLWKGDKGKRTTERWTTIAVGT